MEAFCLKHCKGFNQVQNIDLNISGIIKLLCIVYVIITKAGILFKYIDKVLGEGRFK